MIKVSFKEPSYKEVKRFNDKVTIVSLTGTLKIPNNLVVSSPAELRRWLLGHGNPVVVYYSGNGSTIVAKGKTIRNDNDKDNALLAERIAESKAKLKIYSFVHTYISKYILAITKMLTGNEDNLVNSEEDVTVDSLYGMADRYSTLIVTEKKHLDDLIAQS